RALAPLLLSVSAATVVIVWADSGPDRPTPLPPVGPDAAAPNEAFLRRLAARHEVVAALFRGELTAVEAAGRFRELSGEAALAHPRDMYPGAGEEELAFRQVVHFVASDPRPVAAVRAERLRALLAEFDARFPGAAPFQERYRL